MEIRHVWLAFISTFQDNLLNKLAFIHLFCLFMTSGISNQDPFPYLSHLSMRTAQTCAGRDAGKLICQPY